jgi:hypothetical protein
MTLLSGRTLLALLLASLSVTAIACGPADDFDGDVSGDEEDVDVEEAAAASRPIMRMPFACGQTWVADTRSNHSPVWAVDFNRTNDFGDTVVASAGGEVTRVDNEGNTSYGRWIEIGHGDGWRTRYAHLSVQSVQVGQKVKMGQKIGEVGSTGGSSGPHLHYEQLHNGSPVKVILGKANVKYFETRSYTSHNGC